MKFNKPAGVRANRRFIVLLGITLALLVLTSSCIPRFSLDVANPDLYQETVKWQNGEG